MVAMGLPNTGEYDKNTEIAVIAVGRPTRQENLDLDL
jgi:hypothetical protein